MQDHFIKPVHIVGAGLAGSEAAWQLAEQGIPVVIHEMRPAVKTDAHQTDKCAEMVCSNSFRSDDDEYNAVGLLHWEMRQMNSLILAAGDTHKVPAGGALAVDRDAFADMVTEKLRHHPLIAFETGEIAALPDNDGTLWLIATGPLTGSGLAKDIQAKTGEDSLAFFDAIAPIVHTESINMEVAWFQSRYDKEGPAGTGKDYINCPLDKVQYLNLIHELTHSEYGEFKEWEKNTPYFEGCMPIEVMASRGVETLRYGPMKPVGLTNPHTGARAHAIVQLRQDNALGTLYNIVGFQTKLKWGEQPRVFRMIPGLENAEFARLGGLHRNTFINSPKLLDAQLRLKILPHIRFAGQITGCEGYVESAAVGLLAGRFIAAELRGEVLAVPPPTTAMGALLHHITGGANAETFQPMNVNFGLFPLPPVEVLKKHYGRDRKKVYSDRAKADLHAWRQANQKSEAGHLMLKF